MAKSYNWCWGIFNKPKNIFIIQSKSFDTLSKIQKACPKRKHYTQINTNLIDPVSHQQFPIASIWKKSGKTIWHWTDHRSNFVQPIFPDDN